ncbi:hypothetical protein [Pseudomonas aeruginosa]|uniref:hypothetical protein n=1 Tax=Pseudomonas aeruginosa TaxID=287 RepID=UPI003D6E65B8
MASTLAASATTTPATSFVGTQQLAGQLPHNPKIEPDLPASTLRITASAPWRCCSTTARSMAWAAHRRIADRTLGAIRERKQHYAYASAVA